MIICFAHLAYNIPASSSIQDIASKLYPSAVKIKEQYNINNHSSKQSLCRNPIVNDHDLYLVKTNSSVSIEFTDYKGAIQKENVSFENVRVSPTCLSLDIYSHNIQLDKSVFDFIGFSLDRDTLRFTDKFASKKNINLRLIQSPKLQLSFLDDIGYTCLAFMSTNIERDSKCLLQH